MAYRTSNTTKKSHHKTYIRSALLGIFCFVALLIPLEKLYSIGNTYITANKPNSTIGHHHPSSKTTLFVDQMNAEAEMLGLKYTNYADPAGISQNTVSTALEQLKVASAAMSLSAFREIVNQQDARFPVVGTIKSTNSDLGQDGIIGLKTGNLAHIGNMAIAANRVVGNKHVFVIAVVLGQYGQNNFDSLSNALDAGKRLVESV